jgi:hypothetical protein
MRGAQGVRYLALAAAGLCLASSGCLSARTQRAGGAARHPAVAAKRMSTTARQAQEDAIREAVFRYQFARDPSGLQQSVKVFFISINGKDPSAQFLARFRGNKPPVKGQSESRRSSRRHSATFQTEDRKSGELGLIFFVDNVTFDSSSAAAAAGGYYSGGLASARHRYAVAREKGKWVVKKDEITVIS